MAEKDKDKLWITTNNPAIIFEDNTVGRLKKELWDASEPEIDRILADYGIPSEPELGKAGTYIQTTVRNELVKNRRKNDHLRRFPHPSSLRRTSEYASFLRVSGALHLALFAQPAKEGEKRIQKL